MIDLPFLRRDEMLRLIHLTGDTMIVTDWVASAPASYRRLADAAAVLAFEHVRGRVATDSALTAFVSELQFVLMHALSDRR